MQWCCEGLVKSLDGGSLGRQKCLKVACCFGPLSPFCRVTRVAKRIKRLNYAAFAPNLLFSLLVFEYLAFGRPNVFILVKQQTTPCLCDEFATSGGCSAFFTQVGSPSDTTTSDNIQVNEHQWMPVKDHINGPHPATSVWPVSFMNYSNAQVPQLRSRWPPDSSIHLEQLRCGQKWKVLRIIELYVIKVSSGGLCADYGPLSHRDEPGQRKVGVTCSTRSGENPEMKPLTFQGVVHSKKILVHPKKIWKKSKNFFEDLKSAHIVWEWTTPRFQCSNPFLFIKSSYTQKNEKIQKIRKNLKNSKKTQKIRKIRKNLRNPKKFSKSKDFFWGFKIRTPYLGVNNPSTIFNVIIVSWRLFLLHYKKSPFFLFSWNEMNEFLKHHLTAFA